MDWGRVEQKSVCVWGEGVWGGSPGQLNIFTAEIILQIDEFSFSVLFFHPAQKFLLYISTNYRHNKYRYILASSRQACGSGSALIWAAGSGSGSRRTKMSYIYRKKLRIFMFWSAGYSFLWAEGFFFSLCVHYGGLGITKLQFYFQLYIFLKILIIKTLDSELDPDPQIWKMLDPDPH